MLRLYFSLTSWTKKCSPWNEAVALFANTTGLTPFYDSESRRHMATTRRNGGKPGFDRQPFRFTDRLQAIGMFFQKRSPQHQTMRRLARRLKKAGIPYAIMGAMAVNAHGAERTTRDVDVLFTADGLKRFREEFIGENYEPIQGRSRRFMDRQSGVTVDCLVTGGYPGTGKPGPVTFPDPAEASQEIEKISVLRLVPLIQLKLAARRFYDFGDVVFLIRIHDLDESFQDQLHPSVHQDFIECLEEKRREDEYLAREVGEE